MTKVTFYRINDVFYGFSEQGHTEYAEAGSDILCAALSAMTMLIINAVELVYESEADYTIDQETADITLVARGALEEFEDDPRKRYAISGLIRAYYTQLRDMTEEYYDFLEVEDIETYSPADR